MPDVPQRPLSYGELLNSFHQNYNHKQRVKEQKKAVRRPRKKQERPQVQRHEYSYDQVMERLKGIARED